MLALLRQMSASVSEIVGVLSFMFADYFDATGLSPSDLREQAITGIPSRMAAIIQRAVERGEIDPGRLSPRIASLPVDLVRHDLIMSREPVPEETLVEIVDRIFLPLVLADRPDNDFEHPQAARAGVPFQVGERVVSERRGRGHGTAL